MSDKPDFWNKRDSTSMARSLRLAVVHQQYVLGNLTREQAETVLSSPLSPGDETTRVDDSAYLDWEPNA